MPRQYLNTSRAIQALDKIQSDVDLSQEIQNIKTDNEQPAIAMMCRLSRILHDDCYEFWRIVHDVIDADTVCNIRFSSHSPIILDKKNPGMVYVYKNIKFDIFQSVQNKFCHPLFYARDVLGQEIDQYYTDIQDDKRKNRWTPLSRVWKRIRQSEHMPIARALTRYTTAPDHMTDHEIRDTAEAMEQMFKPLELKFCESPEDYLTMYATGPSSCMGHAHFQQWDFMINQGVHPASWYHYHPHFGGVYSTKGKNVVARAIIFDPRGDGKWYYRRIYGSTGEVTNKFKQALTEQGIREWKSETVDTMGGNKETQFTIPGVSKGNDYVAPMPYIDGNFGVMSVEYNTDTKEFHFRMGHGVKKDWTSTNTGGYISGRQFTKVTCVCGSVIAGNQALKHRNREDYYCGTGCMRQANVVHAISHDGMVIVDKDDTCRDVITGDYFISSNYMVRSGGGVLVEDPAMENEAGEMTRAAASRTLDVKGNHIQVYNSRWHQSYLDRLDQCKRLSNITLHRHQNLQFDTKDIPYTIKGDLDLAKARNEEKPTQSAQKKNPFVLEGAA